MSGRFYLSLLLTIYVSFLFRKADEAARRAGDAQCCLGEIATFKWRMGILNESIDATMNGGGTPQIVSGAGGGRVRDNSYWWSGRTERN